jgi:hypothetical protein
VNPCALDQLALWLEQPDIVACDPPRVRALRASLGRGAHVVIQRHGGVVCYAPGLVRRRLLQFDRRGTLIAALAWGEDERLRWARCRMANGRTVGIEPGAVPHPGWGQSDRLWLMADAPAWAPMHPLTVFQSVDWRRPAFIPPLAEPRQLPPGAGTAVLDVLASVMRDQAVTRVRYAGPYATEALFTALLESFRYDPACVSPLDSFISGEPLDWTPAPHERHHVAHGICVQLRDGVDKVVLGSAAYYRPDWQGVIRREPRRVRAEGDRVVCSLWALGQSLEDRLVLDRSGEVLEAPAPRADPRPPASMLPVWTSTIAELIARESSPILAEAIAAALGMVDLEWGPVPGDLLRVEPRRIRVSRMLRDAGLRRVQAATEPAARVKRAIDLALDVARLLAPEIRPRAQDVLAALPAAEQHRRLRAVEPAPPPHLSESAGRLVALILSGQA